MNLPRQIALTSSLLAAAAPSATAAPLEGLERCRPCHAEVVGQYEQHGMARSVGPAGDTPVGAVSNPATGVTYRLARGPGGPTFTATRPDGGLRRHRIVGRVGAGRFATSWVGAEITGGGLLADRLSFLPVERLTERGLALAPFEHHEPVQGLDRGLTPDCLTCHATERLAAYPGNALGADLLTRLAPIGCEACHGDPAKHLALVTGLAHAPQDELGLERFSERPAGAQRDVCARCHLQGEARIELGAARDRPFGPSRSARALAGEIPVLVPERTLDDFRFVGQVERLARSACFQGSPKMTCLTCHSAHASVEAQGAASFDAACRGCHTVDAAHGGGRAQAQRCADCHMRRSQPFDLPGVQTVDHFVRRRIPEPADDIPHREHADPGGDLRLYDDGRLAPALATPAGQRWLEGVRALALVTTGKPGDALVLFDRFPPPGTDEAIVPTAPADLAPLEREVTFHHLRALALMSAGRFEQARASLDDALALDPADPAVRIDRARLDVGLGDFAAALTDTEAVIQGYPGAEAPWDVRARMAAMRGRADLAARALEESLARWPPRAGAWMRLAQAHLAAGNTTRAAEALAEVRRLAPDTPGLADAEAALPKAP